MISAIVQAERDNVFITRCVNSIKRQTYRDFEITVVNSDEELADAVENSTGEYIFFLNGNEILPANAFEKMLTSCEVECDRLVCIPEKHIRDGKLIAENPRLFSVYGKLFQKKVLDTKRLLADGVRNDLLFVIDAMTNYSEVVVPDDVYSYAAGSEQSSSEKMNDVSSVDWAELFALAVKLPRNAADQFVSEYICTVPEDEISDELVWALKDKYFDNYELNYKVAAPVIRRWYDEMMAGDEAACENLVKYISGYESEAEFQEILLDFVGLDKELLQALRLVGAKNAKFFLTHYKSKKVSEKQSIEAVEEKLKIITDKLSEIDGRFDEKNSLVLEQKLQIISDKLDTVDRGSDEANPFKYNQHPHILEIEDYISEECRNGRVGLKTILKFFKSWVAFKFKRKQVTE